jgi:hypothetical protein
MGIASPWRHNMERLEQIMGEIAQYAPPEKCHDFEKRIRTILEEEKQDAVYYSREGLYEYLYSNGILARPY